MIVHGLDTATAPEAGMAKMMLQDIGGTWWNVYMGGPESGGSGWTPDRLKQYKQQGINHFLLTYVGRQGPERSALLTFNQGKSDGGEACELAANFGYSARGTPVCLDLEGRTFDAAPKASLDYAAGWCHSVRAHGFRPGVYSNPRALIPLHDRVNKPDWIWVAAWITHKADPDIDPHGVKDVPGHLWKEHGQRAWQYAGAFNNKACNVRGIGVDINVADSAVLVSSGASTGQGLSGGGTHSHGTYTVLPGETLSDIAAKLNIAGGWQALYALNKDVIGPNPDLIHPGEVLKLP